MMQALSSPGAEDDAETLQSLARALEQAGLSKQDLIHVIGPGSLPAMLWLCRQGYERVLRLSDPISRCGLEAADALFIPHLLKTGDLPALLPASVRVRGGGALVVRTGAWFPPAEAVTSAARGWGFDLERHICEKSHALYIARRGAQGLVRTAA